MKKSLFLLTAVAVALFSCEKEQDFITENPDLSGKTVTVKASHEADDPEVKTTVDGLGNVEWEATDKLSFVYDGGSAESNAAGVPGTSAEFTATLPGGKEALYLVYPSSVTAEYESSSLKVTVPATQDGTFASAAIEVAEFAASCDLKNLGAILAITTTADVDEIVISSNNSTPLAGKATVAFAAGIPSVDAVASGSTSVTLSGLGGAGTYYAAVLPDSYAAGIYVELKKSGSVVGEKISGNSLTVARRKIMRINVGNPGTIGNKKFVTVSGAGAKDGSSWDNAMTRGNFVSLLKAASTDVTVFMAEGTYEIASEISVNASTSNLKVYGGYPSDATGTSLAGRDITTKQTIISGSDTRRILVFASAGASAVFDGLVFSHATASTGFGSAIVVEGSSNLKFYNCDISNNSHTGETAGSHGSVVRAKAGTILFKGCTFDSNTSVCNGGVMRVYGASVTLDNCVLSNNSSSTLAGGAIHLASGSLTVDNGTVINGNTAKTAGGAINMTGGTLTIDHESSLYNNEATTFGGAIYITGGTPIIRGGSTLHHNLATSSGGAICITAASALSLTLDNVTFYRNRSAKKDYCGGAVCINPTGTTSATVSATDCLFYENLGHMTAIEPVRTSIDSTKTSTGGAFYIGSAGTVNLNRCKFYKNVASQNGGAIRLKGATATLFMNRCYVYDNYVGKIAAGIQNGGGKVAMYNCVVYQNVPRSANTVVGSNLESSGPFLMANSSMRVNTSGHGFFIKSSDAVLVNNIVMNNGSERYAIKVDDAITMTSYGHNLYNRWTGNVDCPVGVDSDSDVAYTENIPTWNSSTKLLTISTLPTLFYNPAASPDPIDYRATPENVEAAIDAFDDANSTGFKTWLTSVDANALMVDITGYTRAVNKTTDKITPGSYQIR